MPRHMPTQKPGRSRQCYVTPLAFMHAIETRFGRIDFDLAATEKNAKAKRFFTKRQNALVRLWIAYVSSSKWRYWLNPPYSHLEPWFAKCIEQRLLLTTGSFLVLVPASVGSDWFHKHVFRSADIYFLDGRICFMRDKPYPKDLMLIRYRAIRYPVSISVWDWKNDKLIKQR